MGKVMTANYRHVTQEEGKEYATRYVLRPGDDPKDLPKEVRKDLEERGMIKDEREFDRRQGVVLPPKEALERYRREQATPTGEAGATEEAQDDETPKGQQAQRVQDPKAAQKQDKQDQKQSQQAQQSSGQSEQGKSDEGDNK